METRRPLPRMVYDAGRFTQAPRVLPEETAVALSFNGSTQAVMMATPADLADFATGFALTEGIARPEEITEITVVQTDRGIDVQCWLAPQAGDRLAARRRTMAGPVGCGLCGIDSLAEALRAPAPVTLSRHLTPAQVCAAVAALPAMQPLHDATRAAHAAAFWTPGRGIVALREDVGRHNALDKLAGAMALAGTTRDGAVVLTSRVSIDMVQKTAALGVPVLIAVSAPTAHAVEMAEAAGITLIALARPDRFEIFTHPHRITPEDTADVA
jgi:FdhD protein